MNKTAFEFVDEELILEFLDVLTGLMGRCGPANHHIASAREQCRHAYLSTDSARQRRKYAIARAMFDDAIEIMQNALENHPDRKKEPSPCALR